MERLGGHIRPLQSRLTEKGDWITLETVHYYPYIAPGIKEEIPWRAENIRRITILATVAEKQTSPFLLTIRWITCTIAITPKRNPAFIISTAVISRILLSKIIRQTNRFYMSRTTGKAGNHSYSIKRTHPIPIRKRMFLSE